MRNIFRVVKTLFIFILIICTISLLLLLIICLARKKGGSISSFYYYVLSLLGEPDKCPNITNIIISLISIACLTSFSAYITYSLVWTTPLLLGKIILLKKERDRIIASFQLRAKYAVYDIHITLSCYDENRNLINSEKVFMLPMLIQKSSKSVKFTIDNMVYFMHAIREMKLHQMDYEAYITAGFTNSTTGQQDAFTRRMSINSLERRGGMNLFKKLLPQDKKIEVKASKDTWDVITSGRSPIDLRRLQIVNGENIYTELIKKGHDGISVNGARIVINFTDCNGISSTIPFVSAYLNYNNFPQNWMLLYQQGATIEFDIQGDSKIKGCQLEVKFGNRLEKIIDLSIPIDTIIQHHSISLEQKRKRIYDPVAFSDIREICFVVFNNEDYTKYGEMCYIITDLNIQMP